MTTYYEQTFANQYLITYNPVNIEDALGTFYTREEILSKHECVRYQDIKSEPLPLFRDHNPTLCVFNLPLIVSTVRGQLADPSVKIVQLDFGNHSNDGEEAGKHLVRLFKDSLFAGIKYTSSAKRSGFIRDAKFGKEPTLSESVLGKLKSSIIIRSFQHLSHHYNFGIKGGVTSNAAKDNSVVFLKTLNIELTSSIKISTWVWNAELRTSEELIKVVTLVNQAIDDAISYNLITEHLREHATQELSKWWDSCKDVK